MKTIALFVAVILFANYAMAQNVGIGTTNPYTQLHVKNNSNSNSYVGLLETNASGSLLVFSDALGIQGRVGINNYEVELVSDYDQKVHLGVGQQHQLTIVPGGNVGIGETAPAEKLVIGSGNIRLLNSNLGIMLNNTSYSPLITRGADAFTSGLYSGVGRWGLFKEPGKLIFGIPNNLTGNAVEIAKYDATSAKTTLLNVDATGKMTRPATNTQDLLPIAMGHIKSDGTILGGTGNFTVLHPNTGQYFIVFNGFTYTEDQYIVVASSHQIVNPVAYATTTQYFGAIYGTANGLGILVKTPGGTYLDQDVQFVMYKM